MLCTPINILYLSITKKSKMVYLHKDDRLCLEYSSRHGEIYPLGKATGKTHDNCRI
jgi:hypothetical protein